MQRVFLLKLLVPMGGVARAPVGRAAFVGLCYLIMHLRVWKSAVCVALQIA